MSVNVAHSTRIVYPTMVFPLANTKRALSAVLSAVLTNEKQCICIALFLISKMENSILQYVWKIGKTMQNASKNALILI